MAQPFVRIKKMKITKHKFFVPILMLIFASSLHFSIYAQQTETSVTKSKGFQELKLDSKLMKREMPYRVILPVGYEVNAAEKFPVVYLLHGLTGHYNNWTDKSKIVEYAKNYNYIVVMPEGDNGWYTDSTTVPNDKYESYIIQELIPEIEKKFRAGTNRESRAIAGLSMGGFGAMKFGLKYPDKFRLIGSFSGALGIVPIPAKAMKTFPSVEQVFGADDSQARKQNDVIRLVREIPTDKIKQLPFIYFDCGTEDFLFQSNRDFADLLNEMKIPHEFRQLPGSHNWAFWDSQVMEFLQVSEMFLKMAKAKAN